MEKQLKNRRGQKRAQIEKEKNEAQKGAQKKFEEDTEKERRKIEELRNMIDYEENTSGASNNGATGNQNVDRGIEMFKRMI